MVAEPLGVVGIGAVEDILAGGHDLVGGAGVDVDGMQIRNAGMVVLMVVPPGESAHPGPRLVQALEPVGVVGPVLGGLEVR
ncbi:MAG: hypothetical protein ACR2FV_04465, partial [Ornithinimicrobium sp.]|uniref:hypothetical protein n=1 Tax=Ornithinimicrobium sp. TaxID=1977084 RepID=UPI003D9AB9D4